VAASLISIIGLVGIAGRLTMGIGADKLGIYNTLILCSSLLALALILLIFTNSLWTFYLFAAAFGFAYGGEVPLIPLFISHFFGIRSMAALMGFLLFISNIGGALGPWVGGKIYDLTGSYRIAFLIGAIAGIILLLMSIVLKKFARKEVKA
jgi:MFS family permease